MDTACSRDADVTMKKRPITLVEILEYGPFQFWFLFVVTASFYVILRWPRGDELMLLGGVSLLAAGGILGVIFLTEHSDNPFPKVGLWTKAFVSSLVAFGVVVLVAPYLFFAFPVGLMLIPVMQGYLLSLSVDEDFGRCFWWSFGGAGLVIGLLFLGAWIWSGVQPVLRIGS